MPTIDKLIRFIRQRNTRLLLETLVGILSAASMFCLTTGSTIPYSKLLASFLGALWIVCVAALFVVTWRSAPIIQPGPSPRAVKGLLPFTERDDTEPDNDLKLFPNLGHGAAIDSLVDRVSDNQTPLVMLRGKAGAGKTSVLRAGLIPKLKTAKIYYAQILSELTAESLIAAANTKLDIDLETDFTEKLSSPDLRVLIIDQFEFLQSGHPAFQPIMTVLKNWCNQPAPYQVKFVIAFREEYDSVWSSSIQGNFTVYIPDVDVKPLTRTEAEQVISTLLHRAGVGNDHTVRNYVSRVADSNGVNCAAIGLGTSIFEEWAHADGWSSIRIDRYLSAGGATGVIAAHLRKQLQHHVSSDHHGRTVSALLAKLVEPDKSTIKQEGALASDISAAAAIDETAMKGYLRQLSGWGARIVERVETAPNEERYRLGPACLPQVLEKFPDASDLSKIKWSLAEQFDAWKTPPKGRNLFDSISNFFSKRRNLLRGKLLKQVLENNSQLLDSDSAARKQYIDKSKRTRLRFKASFILLLLVTVILVYYSSPLVWHAWQRHALSVAQLPSALYDQQDHLQSLFIDESTIHNLAWLRPNRLSTFAVKSTKWTSIAGLANANNLDTLSINIGDCPVDNLDELTALRSLKHLYLFMAGSNVKNLAAIGKMDQLETLYVSLGFSNIDFSDLGKLKHLNSLTLDLTDSYGQNLAGLDKLSNIHDLTLILDNSPLRDLPKLTGLSELQHFRLSLKRSKIRNIDTITGLHSLQSLVLNLDESPIQALPSFLQFSKLECLDLTLIKTKVKELPQEITSLSGLQRLSLDLQDTAIHTLPDLKELSSLGKVTLNLLGSKVSGLPQLRKPRRGLDTLDLSIDSFGAADIQKLETLAFLNELHLNANSIGVGTLPHLKQIRDLHRLTVHLNWSDLKSMPDLPKVTDLIAYISSTLAPDANPETAAEQLDSMVQMTGLVSLELYLDGSQIRALPNFGASNDLDSLILHLQHSQIHDLGRLLDLQQLTHLRLDVTRSDQLYALPDFGRLNSLRELSLSIGESSITDLGSIAHAHKLSKLTLNLASSKVKSLPSLIGLDELSEGTLDIRNSPITTIPETHRPGILREVTVTTDFTNVSNLPSSVVNLNLGHPLPLGQPENACPK